MLFLLFLFNALYVCLQTQLLYCIADNYTFDVESVWWSRYKNAGRSADDARPIAEIWHLTLIYNPSNQTDFNWTLLFRFILID